MTLTFGGASMPESDWGLRRYRRKICGKLQLIYNQRFAEQILWVVEPRRRRRD
jgi:hypothetical protein